jgi:hypothetical protein
MVKKKFINQTDIKVAVIGDEETVAGKFVRVRV